MKKILLLVIAMFTAMLAFATPAHAGSTNNCVDHHNRIADQTTTCVTIGFTRLGNNQTRLDYVKIGCGDPSQFENQETSGTLNVSFNGSSYSRSGVINKSDPYSCYAQYNFGLTGRSRISATWTGRAYINHDSDYDFQVSASA